MKTNIFPRPAAKRNPHIFKADSLASVVTNGKKVNMEAAKALVRHNRRAHSPQFKDILSSRQAYEKHLIHLKQWWERRQHWPTVKIGNRIGKLKPHTKGKVEFPDGTVARLPA